eukprot:12917867-Prorocentrum_lima.AAC.1
MCGAAYCDACDATHAVYTLVEDSAALLCSLECARGQGGARTPVLSPRLTVQYMYSGWNACFRPPAC